MKPLVTYKVKCIKYMTDHIFIFIQKRPRGRKGSKRRSRKSLGSHGSIKNMGFKHKMIDKIFFFLHRDSRIGVFLALEVITEVLAVASLISTIILLIKIGFSLKGVILLLFPVRIGINRNEKYLFPIKIYSVHRCHSLLPENQGSQGLRS